jgi:hypothetical protein
MTHSCGINVNLRRHWKNLPLGLKKLSQRYYSSAKPCQSEWGLFDGRTGTVVLAIMKQIFLCFLTGFTP